MTILERLASARSLLFVPGNRPDRFEKAIQSGADAVILDLEDSVPASHKTDARSAIQAHWRQVVLLDCPLVVRINSTTCDAFEADIETVAGLPGLAGLMVSKAESASVFDWLHGLLPSLALIPLVESAAGMDALKAIASAPGVLRLAVGHIDFMADMGLSCDAQETELLPLRFAAALHSRLNALHTPIDGVTVQTNDVGQLCKDIHRASRLGFGGKLCIHPSQVAIVHEALLPTKAELDWAHRVIEADRVSGGAAVQLEGRMVDLPVVLRARRTLASVACK